LIFLQLPSFVSLFIPKPRATAAIYGSEDFKKIRTGPPNFWGLLGRRIRFLGFYISITPSNTTGSTPRRLSERTNCYAFHTCCDHGPAVLEKTSIYSHTSLGSQRTSAGARPGLGLVLWFDSILVERPFVSNQRLSPFGLDVRLAHLFATVLLGVACLVGCRLFYISFLFHSFTRRCSWFIISLSTVTPVGRGRQPGKSL